MTLSLQDSLGERYEIYELIGEGGAGSVYKARDKMLDVTVAIKVMNSDLQGTAAARLQREAIAAGKLKHKNIAKVFDFGLTADDLTYMVMEYLPGKTLQDYIKEKEKLSSGEAIPVFLQLCDGLAYAHKNGVIHRDLKPSNVILMKDGKAWVAKILDFGVAHLESDQRLTTTGAVVGSPLYMSPEQALSQEVTVQSDIYSMGCLMYETLSGSPPFRGETVIETLQMHKSATPASLDETYSVAQPLALVVQQCLEKEPESRPSSVQALKESLEKVSQAIKPRVEKVPDELSESVDFGKVNRGIIARFSNKTAIITGSSVILLAVLFLSYFSARYLQNAFVPAPSKDYENREEFSRPKDAYMYDGDEKVSIIKMSETTSRGVGTGICDEDLKAVKKDSLAILRIEGKNFTGSGLKYLAGCPIVHLELCSDQLTDENLKYLAQFPKLANLAIEDAPITDAGVKEIGKCSNLNQLYFRCPKLTNKCVDYLAPGNKLTSLRFRSGQFTDQVGDSLVLLPRLKQLEILDCKNLTENFASKLKNKFLNSLNLDCGYSSESLKAITKLPLNQLILIECVVDRQLLKALSSMPYLKALCLSSIKYKEADLPLLSKVPQLQFIDLSKSAAMSDSFYDAVCKMKSTELDFSESPITQAQFFKFTKMPGIKRIRCAACPNISPEIALKFQSLYKIHWKQDIEMGF